MKKIMFLVIGAICLNVSAQRYLTKTGTTEFKASVDAFEPVEAINRSTTVVLDGSNGKIAGLLFIRAFHFEIALMQEHFNENYMDSDKFPKATFKGSIEGFSLERMGKEAKPFPLKGILSIRGKDREINTVAMLCREGSKILFAAELNVKPDSFDIKIPGIVREKIAKTININLDYELVEKK